MRVMITADQPRTHIPKPAKPQFPEVKIGETAAKHPTLREIGSKLTPRQEAANFFTKMKFEAAALAPPYTPYPAPKLVERPWTPNGADAIRAAATAGAKQRMFGAKESYPPLPQLVLAQPRAMVAGEIAGAWGKFGGLGSQLTNLAEVMAVAPKNQETAAKLTHEQNQEWQQLARGRRDINRIAAQLRQLNQLTLSRAIEDQKKELLGRAEKGKKDTRFPGKKDNQKKGRSSYGWEYGGNKNYYKMPDGAPGRDKRYTKRRSGEGQGPG